MDLMEVAGRMLGAHPAAVTAEYADQDIDGSSHSGRFVLMDAGQVWLNSRTDGFQQMSGPGGSETRSGRKLIDRSEHGIPFLGMRNPGTMLVPRLAYLWAYSAPYRLADPVRVTGSIAEVPLVSLEHPGLGGRLRVDLAHGHILDFADIHGHTTLTDVRFQVSGPDLALLQRVRG
ncbi:hypothetical protein [Cryptosporangium phraense]|uniref:Uncharacterized protein n=1 Tax=Cryptosporangium phraense TaxID=2593070 RepID=A0A545AYU6_9ACTN|nr:hypothetical protein [Cryptosporangium phraense]TQS46510.1 hypothetical protein FL583_03750 [Cryptosporangium phraense]